MNPGEILETIKSSASPLGIWALVLGIFALNVHGFILVKNSNDIVSQMARVDSMTAYLMRPNPRDLNQPYMASYLKSFESFSERDLPALKADMQRLNADARGILEAQCRIEQGIRKLLKEEVPKCE